MKTSIALVSARESNRPNSVRTFRQGRVLRSALASVLMIAGPSVHAALTYTQDTSSRPGWTIVTFTAGSDSWAIPSYTGSLEVLVVGGGGAGASAWVGGGGGGGGVINLSSYTPSSGTVTITVGDGGQTGGSDGANSVFDNLTSYGGKGGTNAVFGTGGANGGNSLGGTVYVGGTNGGSGAGAGGAGNNDWFGLGNGGIGVTSSITGSSVGYGGGGSGSYNNNAPPGLYSVDGGGYSLYNNYSNGHPNGFANRGGGGAAGDPSVPPSMWGTGGSGVVILAYQPVPEPGAAMLLGFAGLGVLRRRR